MLGISFHDGYLCRVVHQTNFSPQIFEPQGLSDFTVAETPANTYVLTSTLDPANAPVLAVIRHKHGPIANVWTSRNDGLIHRYSWRYRRIRTPRNIRIKLTRAQSHRIIRTVCGLRGFRTASPAQLFDIFLSHASPHLPTGENASLAKLRHLWHLRIQDSADLQPWLLLKKINLPVMGGL